MQVTKEVMVVKKEFEAEIKEFAQQNDVEEVNLSFDATEAEDPLVLAIGVAPTCLVQQHEGCIAAKEGNTT